MPGLSQPGVVSLDGSRRGRSRRHDPESLEQTLKRMSGWKCRRRLQLRAASIVQRLGGCTRVELGATMRIACCDIVSTHDHARLSSRPSRQRRPCRKCRWQAGGKMSGGTSEADTRCCAYLGEATINSKTTV